ncbi:MAG: BrnT family toxin [bacterium]|nr:BrnT family toxin [bacterium]
MRITGFLWLEAVVEKIERKHHLDTAEVEGVFSRRPQIRFMESGKVAGEDLYAAYGRSAEGRYLTVLFILKFDRRALIVSARDMDRKERRQYGKQARSHT